MTRIEVTPGNYHKLCTIRAYRGDELIYRRLIRKEQEAEFRELLSSTSR